METAQLSATAQRLGQRGDQLARHVAGVFRLGRIAQHHDELVTTEAAKQVVVAQVLVQARRSGLQQRITGGMTEAVVDGLETVLGATSANGRP